jgi:hypothetical protein
VDVGLERLNRCFGHRIEAGADGGVADDRTKAAVYTLDIDVGFARKVPDTERERQITTGVLIAAEDERAYGGDLDLGNVS